ncbi:NADP-dependent oxidoreductase [Virgibacillus sp. W0430]|uniref:NADP-dependent oxidoreductase n=1 Tax=Virgibacillus sp. W0430 TaxID=3391580 RepID=UPI003F46568E
MTMMRAYVRTERANDRVELTQVKIPQIADNEVLVKIKAFGVGVHDRYFIPQNATFPYPIGIEGAGIIVKKGTLVRKFQVGDRVIVSSSLQLKGGSWAEYVAVPCNSLYPLPDSMDFEEGAALLVAGKTGIESMRTLEVKKGDTLFIAGASGAVGSLVIQLAKNKGIRVIGSASKKNHKYMKALGADKTVDYTNLHWKAAVKHWFPEGVEAALAIHPGTSIDSMDVVKDCGKVVTVSGDQIKSERQISVQQLQHQLSMEDAITELITYLVTGKIKLVIEQIYHFDEALLALEKTETRHARGKCVVSM